ncbi:uncharacterized protein SCHCODRAFT_02580275 [Schizophyllum commune H4-8]|uniref:Uncharacterized protein n=1 Tax=Schizophyllum commune (strain H4-8 / FGSC 9210) TaxID=578458 RepID=D8Q684_SCHCM|nr:uncharacterized protein SCHCODRAFT_02580275 [Schizophyllum commune H4-8]KAI5891058.1 hypothetical protein SCHCODRAFT_02580275 [Schizophyllum commune H4-8]
MNRSTTPSRPAMRWKDRARPKLHEKYVAKYEQLRAESKRAHDELHCHPSERASRRSQILRDFEEQKQRLKDQEDAEWAKMVEDRVKWRVMEIDTRRQAAEIESRQRAGEIQAPMAKRMLAMADVMGNDDPVVQDYLASLERRWLDKLPKQTELGTSAEMKVDGIGLPELAALRNALRKKDRDSKDPPLRRTMEARAQAKPHARHGGDPAHRSRAQSTPSIPATGQHETSTHAQGSHRNRADQPTSVPSRQPDRSPAKVLSPAVERERGAKGQQGRYTIRNPDPSQDDNASRSRARSQTQTRPHRQPADTLFRASTERDAAPPPPPKDRHNPSRPLGDQTRDSSRRARGSTAPQVPLADTEASVDRLRGSRARRTVPITSAGARARSPPPRYSDVASGTSPHHEPRVVDGVSRSSMPSSSGARTVRENEAERDRLERVLEDLADEEYHLPNTKRRIPTELDDEFDVKGQVWRLKGKSLLVIPYRAVYEARRARDDVVDCERGYRPKEDMLAARAALKKATDEEDQLRHDFVEILDRWEEARRRVTSRLLQRSRR